MLTFNKRNLLALLGQTDRKEWTGLACADYDRVKFFCHAALSFAGDFGEHRYAMSSIRSFLPLKSTVSPARAPSIASKIGAIVEIPMIS